MKSRTPVERNPSRTNTCTELGGFVIRVLSNPRRANFEAADARGGNFFRTDFADANLRSANSRGGSFHSVSFEGVDLDNTDFFGADLADVILPAPI